MASVSVLVRCFSVVSCAQGVGVEKQSCGVHAYGVAQGECRKEWRASKQAVCAVGDEDGTDSRDSKGQGPLERRGEKKVAFTNQERHIVPPAVTCGPGNGWLG